MIFWHVFNALRSPILNNPPVIMACVYWKCVRTVLRSWAQKAYPLRSSGPPALGLSIGLFFGRIVERLGSVRPEAPGVCSLLSKSSRSERYPVRARRAIPPSPKGEGAKGERPQRRIATNWAQRYLVARASPPTPSPFGEGEQTINHTPFAPVSTLVLGGAAAPHRDSPRNLSEVDRPLAQ